MACRSKGSSRWKCSEVFTDTSGSTYGLVDFYHAWPDPNYTRRGVVYRCGTFTLGSSSASQYLKGEGMEIFHNICTVYPTHSHAANERVELQVARKDAVSP